MHAWNLHEFRKLRASVQVQKELHNRTSSRERFLRSPVHGGTVRTGHSGVVTRPQRRQPYRVGGVLPPVPTAGCEVGGS